jgi:imidazole glycerol-phosphate synthase subunit HisF
MLAIRVIPCLDCKDGRVVKGVKFQGLRDAGAPDELAEAYQLQGADELVVLDVAATVEARNNQLETVRKVRSRLSIPLTVGGGVRALADASALLEAGADKVSINTAAVNNPKLIEEIATRLGSQCAVVAIDAARFETGYEVTVHSGKKRTGMQVIEWARRVADLGAGEILLTSWDRDGTREGYDLELIKQVSQHINIPVIASGGAANPEHLAQALKAGAGAVLAASIFHDGDYTVKDVKEYLARVNIEVRL